MTEINPILLNACLIIEGIAFEISSDKRKILVTDLNNPNHKASFVFRENDLILSVSSFRENSREKAMIEAVHINAELLLDEVRNA